MEIPEWIDRVRTNASQGTGHCQRCPAHKDGRSSMVNPGMFDPQGQVMFVTIEPSHTFDWAEFEDWIEYNEEMSDRFLNQWSGGPILNELLEPFEFSMEDVWMADAIKCPPPGGVDNLKREEAFHHCRNYLVDEISAVDPSVIVTLGNHAGTRTLTTLGLERSPVTAASECGRIINSDPPVVLSTHWGNSWLHQSPRDYWGGRWVDDSDHLANRSFDRYMDVVRASMKVAIDE